MDNIIITGDGQKLLARIAAGEVSAVFTGISTTDDQYTDDELQRLSTLKNIRQQADILNIEVKDDATIVISSYVNNQELEKGYYVATVGIYAKVQGEEEILYGASRVGNRPFLPGFSETLTGISIRFTLKVGNSRNIVVNVDETTSLTTGEFYAYRQDFDEALLKIEFPQFEDYSSEGTEIPAPEDAINQIITGTGRTVLLQYIKASLKGLLNLAQRALSIAMGKNQARVFATSAALDAWLAVPANVEQLNVGDNFYITATDVPDYWWDGTQKQKLETQKVDLTTYDQRIAANSSSISELNGNISSHTHAWSAITGKPGTFTPADHSHDSRYYTREEIINLLKQYAKKDEYNEFSNRIKIQNGSGIVASSFDTAQIMLVADTAHVPDARAQMSFHNGGCNAITLFLETDGTLCFCTNDGKYHRILTENKS